MGTHLGVSKQAARQRFIQPEGSVNCSPERRSGRWKRARTSAGAACSFCGGSEVRLVHGPGVNICSACVTLSGEILEQEQGR